MKFLVDLKRLISINNTENVFKEIIIESIKFDSMVTLLSSTIKIIFEVIKLFFFEIITLSTLIFNKSKRLVIKLY